MEFCMGSLEPMAPPPCCRAELKTFDDCRAALLSRCRAAVLLLLCY